MTCQDDKVARNSVEGDATEDSKYYTRQIASALVVILSTIVTGMTMGYSAVLLPQLKVSPDLSLGSETESYTTNTALPDHSGLVLRTIDEESWIAAAAALAMTPGCWMSSLLMYNLGRKISFLVINPIALIGWLAIASARSFTLLIAGRLLCGLCVGLLGASSSVYIAETSHPRLRGLLLAALSLAVALGIFIVHTLGTWLDWRLTACICAVVPIICFVLGIFIPESPNWLLSRGKGEDALSAWTFLRGDHSLAEFQDLKAAHETVSMANESDASGTSSTRRYCWHSLCDSSWTATFSSRLFFMPLAIICVFAFTSQFSGINVVTFYCVQMLEEVSGQEHAYMGTIILDFIRIVFSVVACWLTRRYPRRMSAMISGIGTCLTLFTLSACLFADFGRPWLPIGLLFVYTGTVAIGLVPLPWLLCAELFDGNSRALGSGLGAGFAFLCFFAVVKTGPISFRVLTPAGTFTLYGTVALLGSAFLYGYLPETKDKSLRDIENVFAGTTYLADRDSESSTTTTVP